MTKEFSNVRNYIVRIAYNECTQAAIPVCSPQSCLIRWYNEPGDITKEFLSKANQFHVTFHGLKITNWFIFLQWNTKFTVVPKRPFAFFYSEMQNFENCTQAAIRFSQHKKKFRYVLKLPFVLWLQAVTFFLTAN